MASHPILTSSTTTGTRGLTLTLSVPFQGHIPLTRPALNVYNNSADIASNKAHVENTGSQSALACHSATKLYEHSVHSTHQARQTQPHGRPAYTFVCILHQVVRTPRVRYLSRNTHVYTRATSNAHIHHLCREKHRIQMCVCVGQGDRVAVWQVQL